MTIPNIFHFVFFGFTDFTFIHFLSILTCHIVHCPDKIYLYYHKLPVDNHIYFKYIKKLVTLEWVELPREIFGRKIKKFQHMADIIRLRKLIQRGGIYLDLDVVSVKPFKQLYRYKCVMGIQAPNTKYKGLCNAVILSEPNSVFLNKWYSEYSTFQSERWDYHSVKMPYLLSELYKNYIYITESKYFFPIDWTETDFMINTRYNQRCKESMVIHLWESEWEKNVLSKQGFHLLNHHSTFSYLIKPIINEFLIKIKNSNEINNKSNKTDNYKTDNCKPENSKLDNYKLENCKPNIISNKKPFITKKINKSYINKEYNKEIILLQPKKLYTYNKIKPICDITFKTINNNTNNIWNELEKKISNVLIPINTQWKHTKKNIKVKNIPININKLLSDYTFSEKNKNTTNYIFQTYNTINLLSKKNNIYNDNLHIDTAFNIDIFSKKIISKGINIKTVYINWYKTKINNKNIDVLLTDYNTLFGLLHNKIIQCDTILFYNKYGIIRYNSGNYIVNINSQLYDNKLIGFDYHIKNILSLPFLNLEDIYINSIYNLTKHFNFNNNILNNINKKTGYYELQNQFKNVQFVKIFSNNSKTTHLGYISDEIDLTRIILPNIKLWKISKTVIPQLLIISRQNIIYTIPYDKFYPLKIQKYKNSILYLSKTFLT